MADRVSRGVPLTQPNVQEASTRSIIFLLALALLPGAFAEGQTERQTGYLVHQLCVVAPEKMPNVCCDAALIEGTGKTTAMSV